MALTETPMKVILPFDQDKTRIIRKRAVYPSNGEMHMRCGKCGSTDFTVFVKLKALGAAQVTTIACNTCAKLFPLNDKGETGGSLTINKTKGARHRELINERHDND